MSRFPVRDAEARLPAAFDTLRVGTALHDPETGRIVDANDRLEAMYGYTTDQLRTMDIREFSANTYGESQREARAHVRAAAGGTPQEFEWRIKRADGRLRWVDIHLETLSVAGEPYVLAEVTDITDYKHNDRRVSLLHRLLRHNLRNEIGIISGFAAALTDPETSLSVETCAKKIDAAAESLTRMSDSIKQIEHTITSDETDRQRHSARVAVDRVVDTFGPQYPNASISITEASALWIDVDDAFDHALTHAIENAIEHAESTTPNVRVEIDESPNTGRVEIRIIDEGPPIPPIELTALDDPRKTTPTQHGSGCGLFVMKWCLEALGGELRIEPATDHGNTVYFYLPAQSPPATAEAGSAVGPSDRRSAE